MFLLCKNYTRRSPYGGFGVIWSTVSPVELRPDEYVILIAGAFRRGAAPEQPTTRWIATFRREHDQPYPVWMRANPSYWMRPGFRPWRRATLRIAWGQGRSSLDAFTGGREKKVSSDASNSDTERPRRPAREGRA